MGRRKWFLVAFAAVATLAVAATAGIAASVYQGQQGGEEAAVLATASGGGPITAVRTRRETSASSSSSTSFVDVPGASASITVPSGQQALILARFSAESYCNDGTTGNTGNWCSARILIDGVEMQPASGFDFAFDTDGEADDYWESNSMDRSAVVGSGSHTVKVQRAVTSAATVFRLDDWSLTVERSKK